MANKAREHANYSKVPPLAHLHGLVNKKQHNSPYKYIHTHTCTHAQSCKPVSCVCLCWYSPLFDFEKEFLARAQMTKKRLQRERDSIKKKIIALSSTSCAATATIAGVGAAAATRQRSQTQRSIQARLNSLIWSLKIHARSVFKRRFISYLICVFSRRFVSYFGAVAALVTLLQIALATLPYAHGASVCV